MFPSRDVLVSFCSCNRIGLVLIRKGMDSDSYHPLTRVISNESNDCPSIDRNSDGVPHGRVDEVELGRVSLGIEVPKTYSKDVEVVPMDVDRVILGGHNAGPLQHELHSRAVFHLVDLGPGDGLPQRTAHIAGVVELHRRGGREVGGVHSGDALLVGLEDGEVGGEGEGHIVHARGEAGPVGALAPPSAEVRGAVEQPQPDREEEALVDLDRDGDLPGAPEGLGEGRGSRGVVERWQRRHCGLGRDSLGRAGGGLVLQNGGGRRVVERCALGALVGSGRHVVPARGHVAADEDVGGLSWAHHDHRGGEGLHVRGVSADDRELVVGDGEEELLVECGVDDPEEVRLARVDWNDDSIYSAGSQNRNQNFPVSYYLF